MGLGIVIFALMAKQFGPEKFGELNYALSFVHIFLAISTLGMQGVVVRDLVSSKKTNSVVIGTSLFVRLICSAFLFSTCVYVYIYFNDISKNDEIKLIVILSSIILFSFSDVFKYWFEASVSSKYVVVTENIVFFAISAVKIFFLYNGISFYNYIYFFALESFLMCFTLFFIFKSHYEGDKISVDFNYIKKLIKESAPLLLASAAWIIYTKVDVIFVGNMLSNIDVGIYTTATKIADVFSFIPIIIVSSYVPILQKINDKKDYERSFQCLYNRVVFLMILIALLITLLSDFIILNLFGVEFEVSGNILKVYIWAGVFSSLAIVSGRYLLLQGKQYITMYRHVLGLIINCPLNYLLINKFGLQGAAISTVISLIISNYILDLFFVDTRFIFKQKSKALLMSWIMR